MTISCDTQYVQQAWRREEKDLATVEFPMGSDPTGNVGKMFGIWDPGSGLNLRGTFVVGPDGLVKNSEVNFYNLGRNIHELMRKFKANLYIAKGAAKGCPANWQPEEDAAPATAG